MFSLAALTLRLARWIDDTTEAPTPSIRLIPTITMVGEIQIFTAARASLPTPRPTNIPSVAVTAHNDSIPSTVGTKYIRNRRGIPVFPRSIASLFIILSAIKVRHNNSRIRIKVLPGHLIRQYSLPSDEDYKTLLIIGAAKIRRRKVTKFSRLGQNPPLIDAPGRRDTNFFERNPRICLLKPTILRIFAS